MSEFRVKGWHVLVVILGFFGVTAAVNATFITLALTTFSGEIVDEPYVQGLHYNDTLAARAAQAELGWTATVSHEATTEGRRVRVEMRDRESAPVRYLEMIGVLGRPATDAQDRQLSFYESGGAYLADTADLAPGEWVLTVTASRGEEQVFEARSRLWAP
jgi:nitrogen fixation protein FixH